MYNNLYEHLYRLDAARLWDILREWERFLTKRVHLIACGGTALTIQGIKPSTKDVDFIVPVAAEYAVLLRMLSRLGYRKCTGTGWSRDDGFVFDLFEGNRVYVTELLDPLLEMGNGEKVNLGRLKDRFKETASYDVNPDRLLQNLNAFLNHLAENQSHEKDKPK